MELAIRVVLPLETISALLVIEEGNPLVAGGLSL